MAFHKELDDYQCETLEDSTIGRIVSSISVLQEDEALMYISKLKEPEKSEIRRTSQLLPPWI